MEKQLVDVTSIEIGAADTVRWGWLGVSEVIAILYYVGGRAAHPCLYTRGGQTQRRLQFDRRAGPYTYNID